MKLYDAHLHFFSRAFLAALARQAGADGPESIGVAIQRAATRGGFEVPHQDPIEHLARWLTELDRHGVDRAVAIASLPEEAEAVHAACSDAVDRLIPAVVVNPVAPDGPGFAKKALGEMGFRALLLFPALHHFELVGESCAAVLAQARTLKAAVIVQCGLLEIRVRDAFGLPRVADPRFANPLDLIAAANRFPEIPFVIPHFGAGFFRETLIAARQCRNIHVDTSGSNGWIDVYPGELTLKRVFQQALGVLGPERILFGTDSTTFPRGWRADLYREHSALLEDLDVSIPDRDLIFGGNLARLLSLKP